MNLPLLILINLLLISLVFNGYLVFRIIKYKKARPESVELKEFLADLMGGIGIVAVSRMDPNGLLYRSPKQK